MWGPVMARHSEREKQPVAQHSCEIIGDKLIKNKTKGQHGTGIALFESSLKTKGEEVTGGVGNSTQSFPSPVKD